MKSPIRMLIIVALIAMTGTIKPMFSRARIAQRAAFQLFYSRSYYGYDICGDLEEHVLGARIIRGLPPHEKIQKIQELNLKHELNIHENEERCILVDGLLNDELNRARELKKIYEVFKDQLEKAMDPDERDIYRNQMRDISRCVAVSVDLFKALKVNQIVSLKKPLEEMFEVPE